MNAKKHFSNLKWFLNWAIRKGYTKQDSINRYRVKFKVTEAGALAKTRDLSASPSPPASRPRSS